MVYVSTLRTSQRDSFYNLPLLHSPIWTIDGFNRALCHVNSYKAIFFQHQCMNSCKPILWQCQSVEAPVPAVWTLPQSHPQDSLGWGTQDGPLGQHCSAVQCNEVQCSEVYYNVLQCSAVQCSAIQCSEVQCTVQYSTVRTQDIPLWCGNHILVLSVLADCCPTQSTHCLSTVCSSWLLPIKPLHCLSTVCNS